VPLTSVAEGLQTAALSAVYGCPFPDDREAYTLAKTAFTTREAAIAKLESRAKHAHPADKPPCQLDSGSRA
jgi:hypothetical protein